MPQIDNAQIAVLVERMEHIAGQMAEVKGMLHSQSATLGAIPLMQAQLAEHGEKLNRAFSSISRTATDASAAKTLGDKHSFVLKLAGTVLLACVGLIGFSYSQLEHFYKEDAALDRRTLLIEYKLGIKSPTADGSK